MVVSILPLKFGEVQEGGFAKVLTLFPSLAPSFSSSPRFQFDVQYRALVYRPIRNEIVEGSVTQVDLLGIRVQVGPMTVFVYKDVRLSSTGFLTFFLYICRCFFFLNATHLAFDPRFPLLLLSSSLFQQIPSDMSFEQSVPAYTTEDQVHAIKAQSKIRLRLTGTRFDATEIVRPSSSQ